MFRNELKSLLLREVQHGEVIFQRAALESEALSTFFDTEELVAFFEKQPDEENRREDYAKKEAVLEDILARLPSEPRFWSAVLMLAFFPMLGAVQRRVRASGEVPEDIASIVDEAFFEALGRVSRQCRNDRRFLRIKTATEEVVRRRVHQHRARAQVFQSWDAQRMPEGTVAPKYDRRIPLSPDERVELEDLLTGHDVSDLAGDDLDLIIQTYVRGNRLREYSADERDYQRLKRSRTRALRRLEPLRERLHDMLDRRLARLPLAEEPWGGEDDDE